MISLASGLHPSVSDVPPLVRVGGVTSSIQLDDLEAVDVLPHASLANQVLTWLRWQAPPLITLPSLEVIVTAPQASLAVAVPNAPLISLAAGLHPKNDPLPPVVIVGGVRSTIHATVLAIVDVLLQPSFAVNVLV